MTNVSLELSLSKSGLGVTLSLSSLKYQRVKTDDVIIVIIVFYLFAKLAWDYLLNIPIEDNLYMLYFEQRSTFKRTIL